MSGCGRDAPRAARSAGFTLLELTVAVAIFAVLSLMSYGGLRTVLEAQVQTARVSARLAELQMAMRLLQSDLAQLAPRGVRDAFGDPEPALTTRGAGGGLALTRAGWRNPLERPRSALQRVEYLLEEDRLMRTVWPVLDRVQATATEPEPLLSGVEELVVRFLDGDGEWIESWPPATAPAALQLATPLPRAVEVSLRLEDWGIIRRLIRVAG